MWRRMRAVCLNRVVVRFRVQATSVCCVSHAAVGRVEELRGCKEGHYPRLSTSHPHTPLSPPSFPHPMLNFPCCRAQGGGGSGAKSVLRV